MGILNKLFGGKKKERTPEDNYHQQLTDEYWRLWESDDPDDELELDMVAEELKYLEKQCPVCLGEGEEAYGHPDYTIWCPTCNEWIF